MADDTQTAPEPAEAPAPDRREQLSAALDAISAPPAPEVVTAASVPEVVIPPPVEEPVWKRPPASWKRDQHDVWQTADPRMQEYAWTREEEMRKGVEQLIPKGQFADQMQKAIEPYEQTLRGLGIEPVQAISTLMQADHLLRTLPPAQKHAYLLQIAQQYGINLSDPGSAPQGGAGDPTIFALQNELNSVRGEVSGWKQQQEAAQDQLLKDEITRFSQGKEDFEEVRPKMIPLLQSGLAKDLPDAYEKALRLDEDLFAKHQAERQAKADAEKREAADKAAKTARAAAVSVRSSAPGARTPTKAQDRRSLLAESFDNITERF